MSELSTMFSQSRLNTVFSGNKGFVSAVHIPPNNLGREWHYSGKHMNKTWEASGLTSPDGETVELASNLIVDGAVEMWLAALEGAMQTALQKLLANSLQAYK